MTYGERLRELRAERRLSLREVEERGGPNKDTMSLIERDVHRPRPPTLGRIARGLGMGISELRAELESAERPLGEVPPSPTQPALNGFEEERRAERTAEGAREAILFARRFVRLQENLNAIRDRMDEYRQVWERRLADREAGGDLDKAAMEEGGRALRAFWPAVVTAAEAELAEMERIGTPPEEAKEHSVLLPAMDRFQALGDRINAVYREMSQTTQEATVLPFPHREAS